VVEPIEYADMYRRKYHFKIVLEMKIDTNFAIPLELLLLLIFFLILSFFLLELEKLMAYSDNILKLLSALPTAI
jgi:hypothetical protein